MMFKSYLNTPPVHTAYEVRTPNKSWPASPTAYYPQKYVPAYQIPPKEAARGGHGRRVTVDTADFDNTLPLPAYMTQPSYTYPTPVQVRETRPKTFASETDRLRAKATRYADVKQTPKGASKKQKISVKVDDLDPRMFNDYSPQGTPPPPYHDYTDASHQRYREYETYHAAPPSYNKTRERATSSPQKPARQASTKKARAATANKLRVATKADVRRWGLASHCEHFCLKNWDPTEEPITLLGSVFDSNSLGKWIYDWTVYHHGAGAPMADEAGQLWLALIELASKRKRAEECLPRIRSRRKQQLVDDYLRDGADIWARLDELLGKCEAYMWRRAKKENSAKGLKTTSFGSNAGCEFVDSIFGRDRELDITLQLVNEIRCWTHDFNDECEEILRRPRD